MTRLYDESAAVDLLAAVVKQARKDLVRRCVKAENRVSALDLFLTIGGFDDNGNPADRSEGSAAVRATTRRSTTGNRLESADPRRVTA